MESVLGTSKALPIRVRSFRAFDLVLFAIAWRNLWRNRRRTWLTVSGIAFAVWMLVFSRSMQEGSFTMMVDNSARLMTGHIQLQHPEFRDDPGLEHLLSGADEIIRSVERYPEVEMVSPRLQTFALASSGERSFGAQILGVVPERDTQWSSLAHMQVRGRYIERNGEAFIGSILARNLGIEPGDELVLLGSGLEGGIAAHVARVSGTFTSGIAALDRSIVQIPIDDFRSAWNIDEGDVHMLIVITRDVEDSPPLSRQLMGPDRASLDWTILMPEAEQMIQLKKVSTRLFFAILAIIVTFSIVNTFMMTVFERTPEFGMLMAIGMRPESIMIQIVIEAFWLCSTGVLLGIAIAAALIIPLTGVGMPLPAEATEMLAQYNLPDRMYPRFSLDSVYVATIVMYCGTLFAAILPTMRIRGMKPVDAIRVRD